jgi:hypothetical protein
MSHGAVAYATDIPRIRRFVGSGDQDVLAEAELRLRSRTLAELTEGYPADWRLPTPQEALAQLINGADYDDRIGFVYAYALEALIETYGAVLDNGAWYPVPQDRARNVELALAGLGASVPVERLVWGGSPVSLPRIEDFPAIGHLEADQVLLAHEAINSIDVGAVEDDALRDSVQGVRSWLDVAVQLSYGLVCFYY